MQCVVTMYGSRLDSSAPSFWFSSIALSGRIHPDKVLMSNTKMIGQRSLLSVELMEVPPTDTT